MQVDIRNHKVRARRDGPERRVAGELKEAWVPQDRIELGSWRCDMRRDGVRGRGWLSGHFPPSGEEAVRERNGSPLPVPGSCCAPGWTRYVEATAGRSTVRRKPSDLRIVSRVVRLGSACSKGAS